MLTFDRRHWHFSQTRTCPNPREIVGVNDEGKPRFEAHQQRMGLEGHHHNQALSAYLLFDMLHLDGTSLLNRPYAERRVKLAVLRWSPTHWQTHLVPG